MDTQANFPSKYIDLHCHLDGSITPNIASQLAALQGIDLPQDEQELKKLLQVSPNCKDLNEFLSCFALPCSLMQTKEAITQAVVLVLEEAQQQRVIYAELRFAPQLLLDKGLNQEDVVEATLEGLHHAPIKANVILCCMRGEGNEAANAETLRVAKKYLVEDGGVVALDLAGAEALFSTANYDKLFAEAKRLGVPFTIHAGEADGAESVWEAINYGAARIGHGVRAFEDPGLLEYIKEQEIPLEMCPTSNRLTQVLPSMDDYPLLDYLNRGIKVTINTDDPGVEDTTLPQEFSYLEQQFGISPEQEHVLLSNAVDAAFASQETKNWLRKELDLL